jgi:integrase
MSVKNELPKNVFVQDGRLFFRRQYKGVKYNAAFELIDSPANRKTCGLHAKQINTAMKLGEFDVNDFPILKKHHRHRAKASIPVFEGYVDGWLDRKSVKAKSTKKNYASLINKHLVPYFGSMPLTDITKVEVEKWLVYSIAESSPKMTNECLRRLKSILRDAADDYGFDVRLDRIKPVKDYSVGAYEKDRIYTLEEASKLYFVMGSRLRTMMLVSMFAGLRTGEVIALKRENIDFNNNIIQVRANMSEGERVTVKTRSGIRDIKMHPVLAKHLAEHLASHIHEFVFISVRGNPFSKRQNFDNEYKRITKLAGVGHLRWYSFRKLFASMRYACSDAVPAQISADMGHSNTSLGLDIYSRAMDHLGCRFFEIKFPIDPREDNSITKHQNNTKPKKVSNDITAITGIDASKGDIELEVDDGTGPRITIKG